ncbi:MAG: hypothetical protein ACK4IS_12050 [Erythrobacter sp.]
MAIVLPDHGHGWGYRHVHGLIGRLVLLAGLGQRELARREAHRTEGAAALRPAASAPVMVPAALCQPTSLVSPMPDQTRPDQTKPHRNATGQQTDCVFRDELVESGLRSGWRDGTSNAQAPRGLAAASDPG